MARPARALGRRQLELAGQRLLGDGAVEVAGERLGPDEFELRVEAREGVACQPLPASDGIVVLDPAIDEGLKQEGLARDVVRAIQQARREAGLHVSDRIRLALELPGDDWRNAVERFRGYVAEQTLASELTLAAPQGSGWSSHEAEISGDSLRVSLRRAGG